MKPKRIILIRHGESEGNADPSVHDRKPDYALDLTDKGRDQAIEAGEKLKKIIRAESAWFYVSPMYRARRTFEGVSSQLDLTQFKSVEEPRIREQDWGHIRSVEEGNRVAQLRKEYGTFYFRIPNGESAADVFDRVSDFFGSLHRDFEKSDFPENAILVTHGLTIRLFLMRWSHKTVEDFELMRGPENCQIIILEMQANGKYKLQEPIAKYDDVTHKWAFEKAPEL